MNDTYLTYRPVRDSTLRRSAVTRPPPMCTFPLRYHVRRSRRLPAVLEQRTPPLRLLYLTLFLRFNLYRRLSALVYLVLLSSLPLRRRFMYRNLYATSTLPQRRCTSSFTIRTLRNTRVVRNGVNISLILPFGKESSAKTLHQFIPHAHFLLHMP